MRWWNRRFVPPFATSSLGFTVLLACGLALPGLAQDAGDAPGDAPADLPRVVKVEDVTFPQQTAQVIGPDGAWLPIHAELSSLSGRLEVVRIEGTIVSGPTALHFRTSRNVEVAPGAPQRVWIYLHAGVDENALQALQAGLEVRTLAGVQQYRRQLGPIHVASQGEAGTLSLLVIGTSPGDLVPWPGGLTLPPNNQEEVQVAADLLAPTQAPDSWLGYQPHHLVIVRDLGERALEAAQVQALRDWVFLGGRVIFAPQGRSAEVFRSAALAALLGTALREAVAVDAFVPGRLLQKDANWRGAGSSELEGGKNLGLSVKDQYTLLDPLPGEAPYSITALPAGAPADAPALARRLYAELPYGRGAVGLVCFDDQEHRGQSSQVFLRAFWAPIVERALRAGRGSSLRQSSEFVSPQLADALKDPQREVGVRVMVGLIGGFVLLIGPVLYFVLKRLNRLPAVLWVEPALVVVYIGVIFSTAYLTKGVLTKVRLTTVFSQRSKEPLALRESYLALFAGAEGTYGITARRGSTVLRPIYKNARESRPAQLFTGPTGELKLEGLALAHWQEGSYSSAGVTDFGGPGIELETRDGGGAQGTVRVTNRLPYPVKEGVIYVHEGKGGRRTGYPFPAVPSGATVDVVLAEAVGENHHEARLDRLLGGSGGKSSSRIVIALVDRSEEDFTIDQPTSLKERFDYFVLLE